MRTATATVNGEHVAMFIVSGLIHRSQWFEFTPYPNDKYRITVEDENWQMLRDIHDLIIDRSK
jgi:hypothetical protein